MFRKKESIERLACSVKGIHGAKGDKHWTAPRLVAKSDQSNRADQNNHIKANEYLEEPDVLEAKVNVLVEMLIKSNHCVVYTGAGLSRAAGIADYASKATNSVAGGVKISNNLEAQPTYSHKVIAALERAGVIKNYVQQNHDGLPQKAGFPQEKINEIHGAWYDPSNPVVQFSGSLRTDLFNWMIKEEKKADLCLCLGTSLSGMNADRMATTPAKRMVRGDAGILGTVIINLQQTHLDDKTALRIWAKLDDVFRMVAAKMNLTIPKTVDLVMPDTDEQFPVPYDKHGNYAPESSRYMIWDLRIGADIKVANPLASNVGSTGKVTGKDKEGNYYVSLDRRYILGRWWVKTAMEGKFPSLPFVNARPAFVKKERSASVSSPMYVEGEPEPVMPKSLTIVQTHTGHERGHAWSIGIDPSQYKFVKHVIWKLHDTFSPPTATQTEPPFVVERIGWGTFTIKFTITLTNDQHVTGSHTLQFTDSPLPTIVDVGSQNSC